ncbi:MAG: cupredoxin domain-containing protein [Actinomycetota bacterium]|nr:cupredoxin domain-containing protein [Actinomycetota bacterium]
MHRRSTLLALALALALAVVGVTACGGSSTEAKTTGKETAQAEPAGSKGERVVMAGIAFRPKTITVSLNTTVRWTNEDTAQHTVTSKEGTELQSELLNKDGKYETTFKKPGTYHYFCKVHPFMEAVVVVKG